MIRNACIIFSSLAALFFICEFSQDVTSDFDAFSDELYYCDWYLLTDKMQRALLILLANAQKPIVISGYFDIQCTRDTFKKVCVPFDLF